MPTPVYLCEKIHLSGTAGFIPKPYLPYAPGGVNAASSTAGGEPDSGVWDIHSLVLTCSLRSALSFDSLTAAVARQQLTPTCPFNIMHSKEGLNNSHKGISVRWCVISSLLHVWCGTTLVSYHNNEDVSLSTLPLNQNQEAVVDTFRWLDKAFCCWMNAWMQQVSSDLKAGPRGPDRRRGPDKRMCVRDTLLLWCSPLADTRRHTCRHKSKLEEEGCVCEDLAPCVWEGRQDGDSAPFPEWHNKWEKEK